MEVRGGLWCRLSRRAQPMLLAAAQRGDPAATTGMHYCMLQHSAGTLVIHRKICRLVAKTQQTVQHGQHDSHGFAPVDEAVRQERGTQVTA